MPPTRIGFRQRYPVAFGAQISVRMEYTLTADGGGTRVSRRHVFKMPLLLRPMELFLKGKIITENERILAALKRAVEG